MNIFQSLSFSSVLRHLSVFYAFLFLETSVWACATCGQTSQFTPKILAIGLGFLLLPMSLVLGIGYVAWKDQKLKSNSEQPNVTVESDASE